MHCINKAIGSIAQQQSTGALVKDDLFAHVKYSGYEREFDVAVRRNVQLILN